MSDTKMEWEEPGGERSRGEYRADGTGTLYSWGGAQVPRTWAVKGNDQVCVTARQITQCWKLEKNSADPTLYRSIDVAIGTDDQNSHEQGWCVRHRERWPQGYGK